MAIAYLKREEGGVRVIVPFKRPFVDALKEAVPYYGKRYDPDQCTWVIDEAFLDDALAVVKDFFDSLVWVITEAESAQRVHVAARAAAQRQTPASSHTASQCLEVVQRVYAEEYDLGVFPPADSEQIIRAVYRVRALQTHPDVAGAASTGAMVNLNRAYELLLKRCKRVAS